MSEIQNQYTPDHISPPGETLLETLETLGMTQTELAERTGRPIKTINEIIRGKAAITPETSLQLERVLGIPARFWNNRERQYRETLARLEEQDRLSQSLEWLNEVPLPEMVSKGWIQKKADRVQQIKEVLNFLGVASPEQGKKMIDKFIGTLLSTDNLPTDDAQTVFRSSGAFKIDPGAVFAWLRKGKIEANRIPCNPYNAKMFRDTLHELREYTTRKPEDFLPNIVGTCSRSGVAVTFIPELKGTRASGATYWIGTEKAVIQISFRYKTNDQFWFTFFHEGAHILKHKKRILLEKDESKNISENRKKLEDEANKFASEILIPPRAHGDLLQRRLSKEAILRIAESINIHPGIVVGRLQHDRLLSFKHYNEFKQKIDWKTIESVVN